MLLSQNDDVFNVGQIRDLPKAYRRNPTCACQNQLNDCAFWSAVVDALPNKNILRRVERGYNAFRKDVRQQRFWNRPKVRNEIAKTHKGFLAALEKLYQTTATVAGDRTLVDSSKSPELALALSLIPSITLYTINLVRDPRAVVVSWTKRNPDVENLKSQAKKWRIRQKLFAKIGTSFPDQFHLLRYEDLTQNPQKTIQDILTWAGLDSSTDNFSSHSEATVDWNNLHLFPPANEGVLAARATDIEIRTADSWKKPEHAALHKLTEDIAFPAASDYGYTLDIS